MVAFREFFLPPPLLREKSSQQLNSAASKRLAARKKLFHEVAALSPGKGGGILDFVKQTSLQTLSSINRLKKILGC